MGPCFATGALGRCRGRELRRQHARVVIAAGPQFDGHQVVGAALLPELVQCRGADAEHRVPHAVTRVDLAVLLGAERLELQEDVVGVHDGLRVVVS